MKSFFFYYSFVFLIVLNANGQNPSAEILDVRKNEFRGVSPIINETTKQTEGFFTFYIGEKVNSKETNFILTLFDNDLKLIKQTPIQMDKKSVIQSSSYNGEEFLFVFNGISLTGLGKKSVTYITIDRKGDIIATRGVELKGKDAVEMEAEVFPAENNGFYIVRPIREKKIGYAVEKVDRNLKSQWENRYLPGKKGITTVESVTSTGSQLLLIQMYKPSLFSNRAELELMALDESNGKVSFQYPLYDENYTYAPSSFFVEKGKGIVCSGMYFEGQKVKNLNSNGIFFLRLNDNGEKQTLTASDWDNGLQKHLKTTKKTVVIGSKPKVLFHQTIKAEDGSYQVIGETFRTTFQLMALDLSGKRSVGAPTDNDRGSIGFRIEDFIIFNFNENGQIINLNKIEKDHTVINVYNPYKNLGGLRLAKLMKEWGYFDFAFTTKKIDSEQEILVSCNTAKSKPYIGMIKIDKGETSELVKIEIENRLTKLRTYRQDDFVGVMKAKPGYIGIYYYDTKARSINIYLEPIPSNF